MEREFAGDDGLQGKIDLRREVADEDDVAAAPHGGDREIHRGGDADDLERDLGPAAGEPGDLGRHVDEIGAQGVGGSQLACKREAVVGQVYGDDPRGAGPLERLDDEEPDHAGSDDHGGGVGREFHALHGVDRDRNRLDHRGLLVSETRGQRVKNAGG